jgi:Tfp pilus assembly pilus retraction ATPase PilT
MQTGQQHGMQTMDAAVAELTKKGVLDRPAATLKPVAEGMAAAGGAH